jgi:hypothetical protein
LNSVWRYDPISLTSLAINPNTNPLVSYLFGKIKRGVDGNFYIPNMGKKNEDIHAYSGAGYNRYTVPPDVVCFI